MATGSALSNLLTVRRKGGQTGKRKPRKSGYVSKKPSAGSVLSRMSSLGY